MHVDISINHQYKTKNISKVPNKIHMVLFDIKNFYTSIPITDITNNNTGNKYDEVWKPNSDIYNM